MKKLLTIFAAALLSLSAAAEKYSAELEAKAAGGDAKAQFWTQSA